MLLLCISLLSCCLSASMGSAIEEFQVNFKALVDLANKEIFLPVPAKKFQCNHVPCQLNRTIEQLKVHCENSQIRTRVSLMEKNMGYIVSALNKTHKKPKKTSLCPTKEVKLPDALKSYTRFFQEVQEKC